MIYGMYCAWDGRVLAHCNGEESTTCLLYWSLLYLFLKLQVKRHPWPWPLSEIPVMVITCICLGDVVYICIDCIDPHSPHSHDKEPIPLTFFTRKLNLMEASFFCCSFSRHDTVSNCCTCHDSTAVVSCAQNFVATGEWNYMMIWHTMPLENYWRNMSPVAAIFCLHGKQALLLG